MPTPIHIPRVSGGRTVTHTTPDYRIFCVKRVPTWPIYSPTSGPGGDEGRVFQALDAHLRGLLSRVASAGSGPPLSIDLFWLTTVSELLALGPHPHELVIWFYPTFNGGLIQNYCTAMMGRRPSPNVYEQTVSANNSLDSRPGLRPCGYTFIDHERPASGRGAEVHWHCVEVYTQRVWSSVPDARGRSASLQPADPATVDAAIGVALGNVAFHEAMHAKVEPMKQQAAHQPWGEDPHTHQIGWDMHDRLDGVAAASNYLPVDAVNQTNINDLKAGLLNTHPRMTVRLPDPATSQLPLPAPPARPRAQGPAIDPALLSDSSPPLNLGD